MSIPKIVHLTWKSKQLPYRWRQTALSWKKTNPDWQVRLWTDEDNRNYIATNYPEFLEVFDSYPYNIQRADAIRYFLLKDFGGVYCDLDIEVMGSLNRYFDDAQGDVFLVQSGNVPVYTNCFMASRPGAKFWDEVIERLRNPRLPWYALSKHFHVMYSTGPLMLNDVANNSNCIVNLLPRNVFMAYSVADDPMIVKPGALLRNLNEGSWNSWDSLVLNFLFRYGISLLIFVIVFTVLVVYARYRGRGHSNIVSKSDTSDFVRRSISQRESLKPIPR